MKRNKLNFEEISQSMEVLDRDSQRGVKGGNDVPNDDCVDYNLVLPEVVVFDTPTNRSFTYVTIWSRPSGFGSAFDNFNQGGFGSESYYGGGGGGGSAQGGGGGARADTDGYLTFSEAENAQNGEGGTWDPVTNQRISQLDSSLQGPATDFINAAQAQGVYLRITQGFRSVAGQDSLYNQGRTTPGSIVTNARGGQSYHNYGLAFDVVIMNNGQPVWDRLPSNIGALGASYGFEWGGNWRTFKDFPHFQMTFGQSILQLQKP